MAELLLTRRAKEDLKALPRLVQQAVDETLTLLEAEPETLGKELRGWLLGLWSCRVGSYRILYTIEGGEARTRVVVRAIRHRGIAYPKSHARR
ncbi:MAG: type II toxin-antitoxin system RelE/ParE family toxin [Actinomycetota bacterium]|nr:type II toxin-antitoxin system RelE/ParE family toxin [Actinomycetota bacterium]